MSKSLPERPDLGQLKQQAKDLLRGWRAQQPDALARMPAAERADIALHEAQRIVAREYGFASWAKLKLHAEMREVGLATARLVAAAALGQTARLQEILAQRPDLARQTASACAVLADLDGLREWAARNPEYVRAKGGVCDTEALGYVCLGRLGGDEAARVRCAEFLLAHGANPNATWVDDDDPDGRPPILYAATGRNNYPALARCLLAAGANPNDSESVYHAAESNHVECLEALRAAGADLSRRDPHWQNTPLYFLCGWSPAAERAATVREGVRWLLAHGADPNVASYAHEETPLFPAIRNGWDAAFVECFLQHGADPNARRADGRSLLAEAVRAGREEIAQLLGRAGATAELADEDRFLGAVGAGRTEEAAGLLRAHPAWNSELADDLARLLFEGAKRGELLALDTAAELGLDLDHPLPDGARPIHGAALHGRAQVVRRLIALGVDLSARDRTFGAPPLGWCVWGSGNVRARGADYPAVAELLLRAGAEPPPEGGQWGSAEVAEVFNALAEKIQESRTKNQGRSKEQDSRKEAARRGHP